MNENGVKKRYTLYSVAVGEGKKAEVMKWMENEKAFTFAATEIVFTDLILNLD